MPDCRIDVTVRKKQAAQEADGLRFIHRFEPAHEIQRCAVKGQRFLLLGVVACDDTCSDFHRAAIGRDDIHHCSEQGGLATAIGPNDAYPLAIEHGEIKWPEEYTLIH